MSLTELIAVLQAAQAGKPIQQLISDGGQRWANVNAELLAAGIVVRVKPEPREWLLVEMPVTGFQVHSELVPDKKPVLVDQAIFGRTVRVREVLP